MMFVKVDDFAFEWTREARLTEEVMNAMTDESLQQAVTAGRRTLGELAWHLVKSIHFMTNRGLAFEGPAAGDHAPESAAVIAQEYRRISHSMLLAVKTQWRDENLREALPFMGKEWTNGEALLFAVMHQAHHRGQMTVLMRQAGLRPPELYGPTYETWIENGLEPHR